MSITVNSDPSIRTANCEAFKSYFGKILSKGADKDDIIHFSECIQESAYVFQKALGLNIKVVPPADAKGPVVVRHYHYGVCRRQRTALDDPFFWMWVGSRPQPRYYSYSRTGFWRTAVRPRTIGRIGMPVSVLVLKTKRKQNVQWPFWRSL